MTASRAQHEVVLSHLSLSKLNFASKVKLSNSIFINITKKHYQLHKDTQNCAEIEFETGLLYTSLHN
jgi:hypothetical protein